MNIPKPGNMQSTVALVATALLAGCVTITRPPEGYVSPTSTVVAEVGFRSQVCSNTFDATLDGNNVTSSFSPQPPAATLPQATFSNLSPGSHTLTVNAKTLQYWFLIPYCGDGSDTVSFSVLAPPAPTLGFAPAGPLTIDAGTSTNVRVTVSPAQGNPTTVSLAPGSNRITAPANATIAAGTASSPPFAVTGQTGGSTSLSATAGGLQNGSLNVNVRPALSNLSATSGTPGTTVAITGAGYEAGASVRFGGQVTPTTFVSASQLTAQVPPLAPGPTNVSVTVNGQTSQNLTFQVLAPPVPAATLLFRTSGQDVQTFRFASGTLSLLDTDAATIQGGTAVVGVAFNGLDHVVRTNADDVQSFNLLASNTLTLAGSAPGSPSGTGAAIAAVGNLLVRAADLGLETYLLVNGTPQRQVTSAITGTLSATGVAVDLRGTFAVRAHSTGIDVYNVSNPAAPVRVGSATGGVSAVGVGVRFAPGGTIAVRSTPTGIEVFNIAANGMPSLAGSETGALSTAVNTAVAIDATGTRVIRTHSTGIEVYDINNPASPQRIGERGGSISATGTGAFLVGNTAFRAMNTALEAYDISAPGSIPAPVSVAATPTSIGVGLSGR